MSSSRSVAVCVYLAAVLAGCHPTYVVVPPDPDAPRRQRIVVHDTVVVRDTVLVEDTVRVRERIPSRPVTTPVARVDTVIRTDTVYRTVFRNRGPARVDTVTVVRTDTLKVTRIDTVSRVETVTRVDTVIRVDTVRVATPSRPGPRRLVLPPGHHPPMGQCRVWREGVPPGRQADASACDALGEIPTGSFILFAGLAWDFDYDWVALERSEPGSVPPEIVAVQRPGASAAPGDRSGRPERPDRPTPNGRGPRTGGL